MYSLVKIKNKSEQYYIKVNDYYVARTFHGDNGTWHAVVEDDIGIVYLRYCSTNRKKAVEGLLKLMIYKTFNSVIEKD